MASRCAILATKLDEHMAMRCPTSPTRFHFHGTAGYAPLTGWAPCQHRHTSVWNAVGCTLAWLAAKEAADRKLPRHTSAYRVFHA